MSKEYEVFDCGIGKYIDEDIESINKAMEAFDRDYQLYQAELEIVRGILSHALSDKSDKGD